MIEKKFNTPRPAPQEGAKGEACKGVLACAFQNMAFMLPTGLLYLLVKRPGGGPLYEGEKTFSWGDALPVLG